MPKVVAYARVSTNKQELANQRHEIARFCEVRGLTIDHWDSDVASGTIKLKDRAIGTLLDSLKAGDTLVVSEVSRISRSLRTVLNVIEDAIEQKVTIMSVKENIVFGDDLNSRIIAATFGLAAQIERSLISARTKEALARKKAEGVVLGRPVGTHRHEQLKLHGKDEMILRFMDKRISRAGMARLLDVNVKTLREYINRQNLEQEHRWRQFKKMDV